MYNSNIRISEQLISSEIRAPKNTVISVPKTDEVLKALHRKAKNGFSATGLSSYIRCPLQFYYKEIAQIYEHKQTEETIDAATLGQVIHDALQVIYTPLIDKRIDVEFIQSQLKNLDNILRTSFSELYIDGNIEYGKNYLINRIAKIYLQRFLKNEIKLLKSGSQIFVKSLEVKYFRNLKVDGISVEIVLKGFVDRLDEKDGILRIIDYKTGSVIKRDLEVKDVAEVFEKSHKEKCFQLMFYAVLLKDMVNSYNDSNCGIYSLKKMSQDFIQLQLPNKNEKLKDCIPEFENELQNLFVEIFNPELSYDQTSDLNICKLCDYKTVCNRA